MLAGRAYTNRWLTRDQVFHNQAREDFERGNLDEVEDSCLDRLRKFPNSFYAHYWLGRVYYERDQTEPARDSLQRARKLNPAWAEHIDGLLHALEYDDGY